jgi:hypothetical protein
MQDFLTVLHVLTLLTLENCNKRYYCDKIHGIASLKETVNTLSYDDNTHKSQHTPELTLYVSITY